MKNRLFPILVATLSLLACQKEDTIAIKIEPSLQAFKKDKIVQEFINYNESFINNMGSPNNESIQLLKKISLNNNEQIKLALSIIYALAQPCPHPICCIKLFA